MRWSIKIPNGYEDKFNKLSKEEKERLHIRLQSIGYYCLVICLVAFMVYINTLKEIAEINYLASLTPEERKYIELTERLEKEQKERKSKEYWDNVNRWLLHPIQVPLIIVFLLPFIFLVLKIWEGLIL